MRAPVLARSWVAAACTGLFGAACGGSIGPKLTHPAGTLSQTVRLAGRACGAASSHASVLYVALIDLSAIEIANIETGALSGQIGAGVHPCTLQFSPDGKTAYVSNQDSPSIGIIDAATGVTRATIPIPHSTLIIRLSRDGSRLFVTTDSGILYVINTATGTIADSATIGGGVLMGVNTNPAGTVVYVASRHVGLVTALDSRSLQPVRTYVGGISVQNIVVSPDGTRLYGTDIDGGALNVWDINSGNLLTTIGVAPAAAAPFDIALTPDGTELYVTQAFGGNLMIFDRASLHLISSVPTTGSPRYIVFDATGRTAAITNDGGWFDVIK